MSTYLSHFPVLPSPCRERLERTVRDKQRGERWVPPLPSYPQRFSSAHVGSSSHVSLHLKNRKLAPRIPRDKHNQLRAGDGGHKIVNRGRAWLGAVLCRPESTCGRFVQMPHPRRERAPVCATLQWLSQADVEFAYRQYCLLSLFVSP